MLVLELKTLSQTSSLYNPFYYIIVYTWSEMRKNYPGDDGGVKCRGVAIIKYSVR